MSVRLPAVPRFGLEFELNRDPYDDDVASIARRYGFRVTSDCSVSVAEDWETCPCCGGDGDIHFGCSEGCCEYSQECYTCEGTGEIVSAGGGGAELVTDGIVDYSELVAQYSAAWAAFGQQDESAGVHLHASIVCPCGHDGQPHYDELAGAELAQWHHTVNDLVGRYGDRNYVHAYGWRGKPLSHHASGPVEYSRHETVESRWLHSTLDVDGFRRAVAFSLSYMSCPGCGNGVGDDDVYRGVRDDATVARWSERIAASEAADQTAALVSSVGGRRVSVRLLSGASAID